MSTPQTHPHQTSKAKHTDILGEEIKHKTVAVPTVGRTVLFMVGDEERPAIVMGLKSRETLSVSLNVFMDRGYINFAEKVPYSEENANGTWHWPVVSKSDEVIWPPKDPKEKN